MEQNSQAPGRRITQALTSAGLTKNDDFPPFTDNAQAVLKRRYLSKDREGNVLEDAEEMFHRVARNLSQADLIYGASEEQRQATEDKFHHVMRRLDFLPNSPTLMNSGRELQQLSACFVLPVEDSLDHIFDKVKQTALIHQTGGGTGFSFSRLRPAGDVVGSTGGIASGPVSFIRAFDTTTDVVKQGGTRRGANMAILRIDHPDVLRFIRVKKDPDQLNNFNVSVALTEEFMGKVERNEAYALVNPRTGQVTEETNARAMFEEIIESAWQTGDPGIVFLDRINRDNPNPQLGEIESTNPCGEQPLLPYESCNLGSVNLARMVSYKNGEASIDWDRMTCVIETAVHMLDNVIDMNDYPIPEIEEMSKATRRIGLGVMGWADLLVILGIKYDSQEAYELAKEVMNFIQDTTHRASTEVAMERGPFPAWKDSIYAKGTSAKEMRNSAPVTIAPTGTISIIAGVSSGIEPLFALSYVRNVMDNTKLVEVNPYFEALAHQEGLYTPEIMEELSRAGTLREMEVPNWVQEVFRVSQDISPEWHVRIQSAFQAHTDNSVSKTINFPESATKEDVRAAYMLAYDTGCKGITIYRDGSKAGQVLSTGQTGTKPSENGATANGHQPLQADRQARSRPRQMFGLTERIRTGHGNIYITINHDENNQPFEVFAVLGKAGGCDSAQIEAISRLVSLTLRAGVDPQEVISNLRGITCCPSWDDGTRVRSTPDALAIALARHTGSEPRNPRAKTQDQPGPEALQRQLPAKDQALLERGLERAPKCPDCNETVEFREGCMACPDPACGWNKCS